MFKLFTKELCVVCEKPKNQCECPKPEPELEPEFEPEPLPELDYGLVLSGADAQPARQNPADVMGFATKFCYFIPLRPGAAIVCFFSFVWSAAEIMGADKQMEDIFPERLKMFQAFKIMYILLCVGLLLATCVLMVGIIQEKYVLINTYIWYACLFTILFLFVTLTGLICVTMRLGRTPGRKVIKLVAVAVWVSLLAYFLVVVNSYKYTLW